MKIIFHRITTDNVLMSPEPGSANPIKRMVNVLDRSFPGSIKKDYDLLKPQDQKLLKEALQSKGAFHVVVSYTRGDQEHLFDLFKPGENQLDAKTLPKNVLITYKSNWGKPGVFSDQQFFNLVCADRSDPMHNDHCAKAATVLPELIRSKIQLHEETHKEALCAVLK